MNTFRAGVLFLLWIPLLLSAQDPKASYDLPDVSFAKSETEPPFLGWKVKSSFSEITVLPGFFVTWGTVNGRSSLPFDDRQSLLFGHPFARTSHPMLSIDGEWKNAHEMMPEDSTLKIVHNDSLLTLRNSIDGRLKFEATYRLLSGGGVQCSFRLINTDTTAHQFGFGHVLDPALGNRGDAVLFAGGGHISADSNITATDIQWNELSGPVAGIRTSIGYDGLTPSSLQIRNWTAGASASPQPDTSVRRELYDATIRLYWDPLAVAAGDTLSVSFTLILQLPDFSKPFVRWNVPRFLSLADGMMHPYAFPSVISLINPTTEQASFNVQFAANNYVSVGTGNVDTTISGHQAGYIHWPVSITDIYENLVVPLSLVTSIGGQPGDTVSFPMFIPSTPISDTGLTVTIDTLYISAAPTISAVFEAARNSNGQKFFSLKPENIFLSENGTRIRNFIIGKDTTGGVDAVDLVFVLDVTGSMGGIINSVKDNIIEFADSLKGRGIDYRLGMVTFLDEIENVYDFVTDAQVFKNTVAQQFAHGGGDGPENSLEALYQASQFSFRNDAKRVAIWITDISYHENDPVTPRTKQEVVNVLLESGLTVHAIGPQWYQTEWYNPIIEPTGGNFYDINGNFRDILLNISRMRTSSKFLLSYTSSAVTGVQSVKIEIHVAGLGGSATTQYGIPAEEPAPAMIACFPNPFNPYTSISVNAPAEASVRIVIFDILGREVKHFSPGETTASTTLLWDATDNHGRAVGSGVYLIRAEFLSAKGTPTEVRTVRALYLK